MPNINFQFTAQAGYTGDYRVIAYKSSNPLVSVVQVDISPTFAIPVTGSLSVPTTEPYIIKLIALDCNKIVGQTVSIPAPTPIVIHFSNSLTSGMGISRIFVDGVNILPTAISSGNTYNHPSDTLVATNPHNYGCRLTGVANRTPIKFKVIRAGSAIYVKTFKYNGTDPTIATSVDVVLQDGDTVDTSVYTEPSDLFEAKNEASTGNSVDIITPMFTLDVSSQNLPLSSGENASGIHSGWSTGISVDITVVSPVALEIYRGTTLLQSITTSVSGAYTFNPFVFTDSEKITIKLVDNI